MAVGYHPGLGRLRPRSFASPRLIRFLAGLTTIVAWTAPIMGVAYLINGATQTRAFVEVPVIGRPGVEHVVSLLPDSANPWTIPPPDEIWLETSSETLTLITWGSTMTEQLLSRGGVAVLGVCAGLGGVLLRRLLLSIAQNQPFQAGNPRRIAGIAVLVLVAGVAIDAFPALAANLVLDRVGLSGPVSPLSAPPTWSLDPLLIALLLLAVAEAFRRGSELARDVDGLV